MACTASDNKVSTVMLSLTWSCPALFVSLANSLNAHPNHPVSQNLTKKYNLLSLFSFKLLFRDQGIQRSEIRILFSLW
jgi:hypothetical protein